MTLDALVRLVVLRTFAAALRRAADRMDDVAGLVVRGEIRCPGLLDMNDPRQEAALRSALDDLTARRIIP